MCAVRVPADDGGGADARRLVLCTHRGMGRPGRKPDMLRDHQVHVLGRRRRYFGLYRHGTILSALCRQARRLQDLRDPEWRKRLLLLMFRSEP